MSFEPMYFFELSGSLQYAYPSATFLRFSGVSTSHLETMVILASRTGGASAQRGSWGQDQ